MTKTLLRNLLLLLVWFLTKVRSDMIEAANGDFPYVVAIRHNVNYSLICGGTLIRNDVVLTNGVCLFQEGSRDLLDIVEINILGGNVNLTASAGAFPSRVMKVTINTDFVWSIYDGSRNNYGLIQLVDPIPNNLVNVARPVEITEETPPYGTNCKITNWAPDRVTGIPRNLHSYDVMVVHVEECNHLNLFHVSPDVSICTNWENNTDHYGYQGSQGGSLVCNNKLMGIAAVDVWRPNSHFGGYSDMSVATTWIERNIFDGRLANEEEHPYLVYIRIVDNFDEFRTFHHCVGVLINEDTILTVARCAILTNVDLYIGITVLPTSGGQSNYTIKELIVHEDFSKNKIALIKLEEPVSVTIFPKLSKTDVNTGSLCTAVGWGPIHRHQNLYQPKHLLSVNLSIWDQVQCKDAYPNSREAATICAGNPDKIRNFCEHDFGGPLFCDGVLKGIYSFGDSCTRGPSYPAVYTDVSHYTEWIARHNSGWTISANLLCLVVAVFSILTIV